MASDTQDGTNGGAQLTRGGFPYAASMGDQLQQGDVLALTPALDLAVSGISKSHPDVSHAIVLTQSCDLVRRAGQPCRAAIVVVAPVVPFATVVRQEIAKSQLDDLTRTAGVAPARTRDKAAMFVERVLNNNEADYFFLRSEGSIGLTDDACALLRQPLTTDVTNYDVCMGARLGSLSDIFQARLGWSVGHLYSRVATEDWVPKHASATQFTTMISQHLESVCRWHDEERLKLARESVTQEILSQGREAARQHIARVKVPTPLTTALDRIEHVMRGLLPSNADDGEQIIKKLKQRLQADPIFKSAVKK